MIISLILYYQPIQPKKNQPKNLPFQIQKHFRLKKRKEKQVFFEYTSLKK